LTCVWLTACGQPSPEGAAPAPAEPPAALSGSAPVGDRAAESRSASGGIVIRAQPGGDKPKQFCIPEWSIHNETGQSVGALLVNLHWQAPDGTRLDADTGYGALIEPLPANGSKRLTLNGYPRSCDTLTLVVGTYACRDDNAVRQPCPGPVKAESTGGVRIDLTAAAEGPMKGAMEAQ
jgi:hypothetical protein